MECLARTTKLGAGGARRGNSCPQSLPPIRSCFPFPFPFPFLSLSLSLRRLPRWTSVALTVPFIFVAVVIAWHLEDNYAIYFSIRTSAVTYSYRVNFDSSDFFSFIYILFYIRVIYVSLNNPSRDSQSSQFSHIQKCNVKALSYFSSYVYQFKEKCGREYFILNVLFSILFLSYEFAAKRVFKF